MAILKPGARAAFGALLGAALGAGCTGVALRPDGSPGDEKCPEGAREAMESFALKPGLSALMEVDATHQSPGRFLPLVIYDGPVESVTRDSIAELPAKVRLQGWVWTSGPRVIIRYYSARLPDGRVIPFCAVAAENGPGLPKGPGRPGSAALRDTSSWVFITGQFK